MATLAPAMQPGVGYQPLYPVRFRLPPTEDLAREPDGVPHTVVGLTALFSVMLALLVGFMFLASPGAAVVLVLIAVPVLVGALVGKAERDRDHLHPSR